jgi:hypothetical protein
VRPCLEGCGGFAAAFGKRHCRSKSPAELAEQEVLLVRGVVCDKVIDDRDVVLRGPWGRQTKDPEN